MNDKLLNINRPKAIGVKVTRAERRGGKIVIAIEPDLLTGEEFTPTPFYNEGREKNKLQYCNFNIKVREVEGRVKAEAHYSGDHYTTGHTQIFFGRYYKSRKDSALGWVFDTSEEWLTDDRCRQIAKMFEGDNKFIELFKSLFNERKRIIHDKKLNKAKENLKEAVSQLDELISNNKDQNHD